MEGTYYYCYQLNAEYIKNLFNIHQHCRVGTGKVVAGLGLAGYGLATNNNNFINAGGNLAVLGAGTKLLAHVFGKKK